MEFETLEQALEYITQLQNDIKAKDTAYEGLKAKVSALEDTNKKSTDEINRLKIKNYEYFEQISRGNNPIKDQYSNTDNSDDTEEIISINDIAKDIRV